MNMQAVRDNTIRYIGIALAYTIMSVIFFGVVYPFVMTGIAQGLFPTQAGGSIVYVNGKPVGSAIIGQLWAKPQYFHGRPSAAGKGYDPTSTGGTNLGPLSKKLVDATKATAQAARKENPGAAIPLPMDLITSSASGIDPDISPEAAIYQTPRIARARGVPLTAVMAIISKCEQRRTLGFLGEPRINVLQVNLALDQMVGGNAPAGRRLKGRLDDATP